MAISAKDLSAALELHRRFLAGVPDTAPVNLSWLDMTGLGLDDSNLSEAILIFAKLSYADLSGTNLSHANLSHADLSNANLAKADLSDTKLNGTNMYKTNLTGLVINGERLSLIKCKEYLLQKGAILYLPPQQPVRSLQNLTLA